MLPPALYQNFTCPGKLALHAQLLGTHGLIEVLKPPYTAPLPPKQFLATRSQSQIVCRTLDAVP